MAMLPLSPAQLAGGELAVTLRPEIRVTGSVACRPLTDAGEPIPWVGVYAIHRNEKFAWYTTRNGKFEFILPPGDYTFLAYGEDIPNREAVVSVPAGREQFTIDPIPLDPPKLFLLRGKPAPELEKVVDANF